METPASLDQLGIGEILSRESINKLDKNSSVMEADDVVQLSPPPVVLANGGASLGPTTPDSNKEIGDLSNFTSPLTSVSSPPRGFDSHSRNDSDLSYSNECSPCTPKESVFDPFAPGPDELMLAPHCMKVLEESWSYVARRLNFNPFMNTDGYAKRERDAETICDDDMLLETVYDTLLEAIVSKQAEEIVAEISPLDPSSDEFNTPTSAPRLNGIAETCPAAPLKPSRKLRNIDLGLCKKLEF